MANDTKKALIVGASRGLGLGLVQELASRGWEVTATARDLAKATGLRDQKNVHLETIDIDDGASAEALAKRLSGQTFDLVFINAGITGVQHNSADLATQEELGQLFATNAASPIRLARKLVGNVKTGTGILAFMSSGMGSVSSNATAWMELYSASKAALNSLIHSFVIGLSDKSVTVLAVNPGWVRTDMGGENAPLDVATSSRGTADMLEKRAGTGGIAFVDYENKELAW